MFKSLILIAACLALSSAEDPRHLGWAAAKWRIQRRGTLNPHRVPANQIEDKIALNTITNGRHLEEFPDELQEQVANDYDQLVLEFKRGDLEEVQVLEVPYGYSERTGWVTENKSDEKWSVCLLKDRSMVMISPISATIRIIVPPTISYGELALEDDVDGGCVNFSNTNVAMFRQQAIKSLMAGKNQIEIPITSTNATAKFEYVSRQGANTERLTLAEALRFEDDAFVAYFQKSFKDFAAIIDAKNQGAKHHIHIEWMPIRKTDLDKTVIGWILIDAGYVFDKTTTEGRVDAMKGVEIEIDAQKRADLDIETAEPHNTVISTVCPDEGRSPIALQVCPISRDAETKWAELRSCGKLEEGQVGGTADNGGQHCANIRNFMLEATVDQVKTLWREVGAQALRMAKDTDAENPLRIWTIGGSIGWLHIKMCRDFNNCDKPSTPEGKNGKLCEGWATQCATAQAKIEHDVAWHDVHNAY